MTGLLPVIMSIPWSEVLIGMSASRAALIVPALLAGVAFAWSKLAGVDLRRRPASWGRPDLVYLREEIDRSHEALVAAEAQLIVGGAAPAEQAERAANSEDAESITKAITQLRIALVKVELEHGRRPWWFRVLQRFAGSYLMYLFFFILGVIATLLVAQPR